jgi:uncharacterized protein (DUF1330 family)
MAMVNASSPQLCSWSGFAPNLQRRCPLARSVAAKAYEDGKLDRTVLIEFDSVDQAVAVHDTAAYQAALTLLDGGAVRDLRIVPGT